MSPRSLALAACFCWCVACLPAGAQTPPTVPPPFSQEMADRVTAIARDAVRAGRAPSIAVGIVEDGRLLYARGFGLANIEHNLRARPDTEYYAGGLTMQFTAAAVLMLADRGKLKLDDTVTRYVPELKTGNHITIGQLLAQTSGLADVTGVADPTRSIKQADLIAAIDAAKPVSDPGASYADNPVNYLVASIVVERVSGVPLSDFLQQNIFLPLVMDKTFVAGDNGIGPDCAAGYAAGHGGSEYVASRSWDPAWMSGALGLVSTVYDLAKWDIEMPVLLRIDAMRAMFAPSASAGQTRYGYGWVIDRRNGRSYAWYAGHVPGYDSFNALLPDDHIAVIVLTNADGHPTGDRAMRAESLGGRILDIVDPPAVARLDNAIVMRAKEWLARLADKRIDRTQLTPGFSAYLTDELVRNANVASLGALQTIVPLSSTTQTNGETLYEFLVRFASAQYHYKFAVTPDGKIDELLLDD